MICSCPPFECLCGRSTPRNLMVHQAVLSSVMSSGSLSYHVPDMTSHHHVTSGRTTSDYGSGRRRRESYMEAGVCGEEPHRELADEDFSKACSEFTSAFIPCMSPGEPLKVDANRPNCMYGGGERPSPGHHFYLSPSQLASNGGACYESKAEPGMYSASSEVVVSSCRLSDFEMTSALDPSLARTSQSDVLLRLATAGDDLDCALLNLPSITPFLDDVDAAKTSTESVKPSSDTSRADRYYADSSAKSDRQPCSALTRSKPVASPRSLVELKPMASCKKSCDSARPGPGEGFGGGLLRQFGSAYVSDAAYQHLVNPGGKNPHTDYFETFYREEIRPYSKTTAASALQNHSINITVSYT